MSTPANNNHNGASQPQELRFGMDIMLLQHGGKALKAGQSVKFQLIKGPTLQNQHDPVNSKAPPETFPQVIKFTETVTRPHFSSKPWTEARFYQQDVPKVQDDSDGEEAAEDNKPKKKRWRRPEAPRRQWMLQEKTDFLETTIAKRQKKQLPSDRVSTRYEGVNEHNPSQYVVLRVQRDEEEHDGGDVTMEDGSTSHHGTPNIVVTPLPPNSHINFSQPANRKTLSMTQAEQAIQDQRGNMTRYMMHTKANALDNVVTQSSGGGLSKSGASGGGTNVAGSKARLMGRLQSKSLRNEDGEEDDIMGDLTFKTRKGGSSRARKELLTTLGDSNVAVDDDGVLGGTNDAEFGGKRHFGKLNVDQQAAKQNNADQKGGGGGAAGNDGLAMADDFYQRDVKEEYEELDYDANEQFDDDDVDLGESEVVVDTGGFAADEEEDDDDFVEEEREGAEGLATIAGFRQMLAKARGETVGDPQQQQQQQQDGTSGSGGTGTAGTDGSGDGSTKKPDGTMGTGGDDRSGSPTSSGVAGTDTGAATSPGGGAGGDTTNLSAADAAAAAEKAAIDRMKASAKQYTGNELDENGDRLITLEAVRKEIWLRNGAIVTKRLMKIFNIKKKTAQDRKAKFQTAIKELCTFQKDAVQGNMLVLKQHYANMG